MDDDRPFGYDTLKFRAVFVPGDESDKISAAHITAALGYGAVKIPAVFVPEGSEGPRPGYPYVHVGRYVMRGDGKVGSAGWSRYQAGRKAGRGLAAPCKARKRQKPTSLGPWRRQRAPYRRRRRWRRRRDMSIRFRQAWRSCEG
jgi:hypothetical protein